MLNDGKVDVSFSNFNVPVPFGLRIAKFLRVNVGPMASPRSNRNGKNCDLFNDITVESLGAEFKNRLAFGCQAGVGIDLGRLRELGYALGKYSTDVMKILVC